MIRRLLTGLVFMLFVGTASAQYRVDRLITAGRSALYYEDYVLSIKYFNLAIGAKPYLYEPWYYRSVAKFNLDDFVARVNSDLVGKYLNIASRAAGFIDRMFVVLV